MTPTPEREGVLGREAEFARLAMSTDVHGAVAATKPDAGDAALVRLARLAADCGAEQIAEEASSLSERVSEGRFYVACVGQFKRGKSTLLNALIGERVLPAGVVPVTAVPTVIRHGESLSARVRVDAAGWREIPAGTIEDYVSEERNPENSKRVTGLEVFVPSALLATGMCLVDTPGLGSVFSGNTAATQAFVPHIDAALVVLGADPPIGGEELGLVEEVGRRVSDLLVVLNKADRTTNEEREETRSFTRRVIETRLGRAIGPIYELSATERLDGRGPARDWEALVDRLEQLVTESGSALANSAGGRGLLRLSERMRALLTEERDALLRPIQESERRITALTETLAAAEQSMRELGFLLTAEQHRLSDLFLERRKRFLAETYTEAQNELAEALAGMRRGYGPKFRVDALRSAQVVAEECVLPWLDEEQSRAEEEYRNTASRFVGLGNEYLKRLAETGIPELSRVPNALDPEAGFRVRSRFTFRNLIHVARPASPLRYVADAVLGMLRSFAMMERDARDFLNHLLEMNSARVQSDVIERVQESRSRLEVEIRRLLHEVGLVAQRALERARKVQAEGAPAVEAALARIRTAESELVEIGGSNPSGGKAS
jgi:Dynamin family